MSNLLNIEEIRNRMFNCKPTTEVVITFGGQDLVFLDWVLNRNVIYRVVLTVNQVRANCRVFERAMHKAKRAMRGS